MSELRLDELTCPFCGCERTTLAHLPVAVAFCLAPKCARWVIERRGCVYRAGRGMASYREAIATLAMDEPVLDAAFFYTLGGRVVIVAVDR